MKKLITSLLVIVILFNFICCNNCSYVYADDDSEQKSAYTEPAKVDPSTPASMLESGTVPQKQGAATKATLSLGSLGTSALGTVTGILARAINFLVLQLDLIMGILTMTEEGTDTPFWLTIDRIVFNRVALFNINYLNTDDTYEVGELEITANSTNIAIKKGITNVYQICRLLAISISLLVLIYIGIRMALSTVASDQARYKKMLVSWIESIIIMFFMIYIISAVVYFGEVITNVFFEIRNTLLDSNQGYGIFEDTIRSNTLELVFSTSGLELTIWSIIYWCLLFMEVKFFWLYAKRLLMVGLLIIISPLITITYPIDKAGDGRAQVFSTWMKEFIVNVLIQPLHALIYLIFVLTANSIAQESPLVALVLLMSMGTVERMVKVIFNMSITTLRGVNKFMKKEG